MIARRRRERIGGASRRGREAAAAAAMNHTHTALMVGGWWVGGRAGGSADTHKINTLFTRTHAETRTTRAAPTWRPPSDRGDAAVPRAIRSVAPAFERCPSELEIVATAVVDEQLDDAPARARAIHTRKRGKKNIYTNTRREVLTL